MSSLLDNLLNHPVIGEFPQAEVEMVATALLAAFPNVMSQPMLMTVPLVHQLLRNRDPHVGPPHPIRFDVNLFQDLATLEGDLLRNKRFAQELARTKLDLQHSQERVGLAQLRKEELEDRKAARRLRNQGLRARVGLTDEDMFVVGQDCYDADTLRWAKQSKYRRSLLRGPLYDDVIWQEAMQWLGDQDKSIEDKTLFELSKTTDFPIRAYNILANNFSLEATLGMILALREYELLDLPNFGPKALEGLKTWLAEHDLELRP